MKVLHYVDCASLSWEVPYIAHMKALAELGVEQTLLCRAGENLERLARENGIPVRTWQPLSSVIPVLSPNFVSIVKELSPDIIHTRLLSAAGIAGAWRPQLEIPVVATFDKPGKAKYYENIDRYISCASWLKQYMSEHEGLPAEKIDVVHNPADTVRFAGRESNRNPARAQLHITDDETLISGMGIFIHRKGFDVLLRAFAKLFPAEKKLRLALIGGGGDQREAYLKLADQLGIRDKLLLPERFVEDVRPWLWASDIFVMPSREEGFSIALLEALAAGLPTIVSDIAPFTEIIRDGENGLVAKKNNVEAFARALKRMLDMSPEQRNQLVQNAQKLINNFTPEATAQKTLAVYEKVLKRAPVSVQNPKTYPLISVVVPAYNMETRLAYALESIIAQDYPNLEIIVVNDASTDFTEDVARRVLEGCGRPFTIINHEENSGETASRNTGMDAMKGEYVWFIDADDMAEPNLVSALYDLIEEYKCDISLCGLKNRYEDGRPDVLEPVMLEGAKTRKGEEMVWLRVFNKITPHVCGMLLRKTFLLKTGLRFHEGCTNGGDVEFQLKALCRAEEVAYTPDCLYIYMHHAGMGSVRDNNTPEKHKRRYLDNTGAHLRAALYLSEHATSEKIRNLGGQYLMAQSLIRRFTLCAKAGDKVEYDALLADSDTRRKLGAAKSFFADRPEVYLKAFALLHFPDFYYRLRRG